MTSLIFSHRVHCSIVCNLQQFKWREKTSPKVAQQIRRGSDLHWELISDDYQKKKSSNNTNQMNWEMKPFFPDQTRVTSGRLKREWEWDWRQNNSQQQRRHINTTLNILIKIIWRTFLEGLGSTLSSGRLTVWCFFFIQLSLLCESVCPGYVI